MKKYVALFIAFLCSIGLTSCWFKSEKYAEQADVKVGDIIDSQQLEQELIAQGLHPRLRLHPLSLGKIHYFDEIVKRHSNAQEAFNEIIDASMYPYVIIDFYADWCGPCKALGTLLHDIALKNRALLIVKINIEYFPEIAQQYNVKTLPTLLFFKKGTLIKRTKGFNKKELLHTIRDVF